MAMLHEREPTTSPPLGAYAPRRRRFEIDDVLARHLAPSEGDVVADLGCGTGMTLAAVADRSPSVSLIGLDRDQAALEEAAENLASTAVSWRLIPADLSGTLPLATESVDRVVCHNLLELIADPGHVLAEAWRVMRPGARAVWSHIDFDSVVVNGADMGTTRRILHDFADLADGTADQVDGLMGRKLAGLVRHSPLALLEATSHALVSTTLTGPARWRVESTVAALREASLDGRSTLTGNELEEWRASLDRADDAGWFFYSQATFIMVTGKASAD